MTGRGLPRLTRHKGWAADKAFRAAPNFAAPCTIPDPHTAAARALLALLRRAPKFFGGRVDAGSRVVAGADGLGEADQVLVLRVVGQGVVERVPRQHALAQGHARKDGRKLVRRRPGGKPDDARVAGRIVGRDGAAIDVVGRVAKEDKEVCGGGRAVGVGARGGRAPTVPRRWRAPPPTTLAAYPEYLLTPVSGLYTK